jgi:hypothetical protein
MKVYYNNLPLPLKEKGAFTKRLRYQDGDPGGTRTFGPQLRRLLLYPTELLGHR